MSIDPITQAWIRNEADARAAAGGCRFDLERAGYAVWWIERFCRLYEGEWAGEPLFLLGAFSQPKETIPDDWHAGGCDPSLDRARRYMKCFAAGERVGWQYEVLMRIFGWVKHSNRWNREVRRFRKGSIWLPKKNGKSPTLAAVGLYLLAGDGESGQKVFLAAKDGTQARDIAGQHALEMVRSSHELSAECDINLSKMRISHTPTRSYLQPLSSGDSRTQQAKEGINGSVLVDETHVVDRDFISRIVRAGISRSEPLFLQFSTAGKDPDSYGKEEFDYGLENNDAGKDDSYFFAYYGAPQTLSDEDLAADPAGIIASANPSIGHTIDADEALADYHASTGTIAKLADFKTYRLNVWQRSSNPWLRAEDWLKCRESFHATDLQGHVCAAGLDLGKTDDMSALSLVFPENADAWTEAAAELAAEVPQGTEGKNADAAEKCLALLEQPVKVLTWYWLPEDSLQRYKIDAPYEQWARAGRLRLTSTMSRNTVDPTAILVDIRAILKNYDVKMFAFDPWYAGVIVESLKNQDSFPDDYCWPFAQTIQRYAWPSALFERLVLSGKLHHDGNPITAWEAGHVQHKQDNNGNMRPVKPLRQDSKKIDGIVATIMALDAATRLAVNVSVYETRGLLSV